MMEFVHRLSKQARRRILDFMLARRSLRELAEILEVTPAAIAKYKSGATHPSDEVLIRLFENASDSEVEELVRIVMEDLMEAINSLCSYARSKGVGCKVECVDRWG
jgi:predicted transcriptional regulator